MRRLFLLLAFLLPLAPAQAALRSPPELERLAAPLARYPESLLSLVLAASRHPAQVQSAAQWLRSNRGLPAPEIASLAALEGWDPSVAALTAQPQVLETMARYPEWLRALGEAYAEQQPQLLDAVQQSRLQNPAVYPPVVARPVVVHPAPVLVTVVPVYVSPRPARVVTFVPQPRPGQWGWQRVTTQALAQPAGQVGGPVPYSAVVGAPPVYGAVVGAPARYSPAVGAPARYSPGLGATAPLAPAVGRTAPLAVPRTGHAPERSYASALPPGARPGHRR